MPTGELMYLQARHPPNCREAIEGTRKDTCFRPQWRCAREYRDFHRVQMSSANPCDWECDVEGRAVTARLRVRGNKIVIVSLDSHERHRTQSTPRNAKIRGHDIFNRVHYRGDVLHSVPSRDADNSRARIRCRQMSRVLVGVQPFVCEHQAGHRDRFTEVVANRHGNNGAIIDRHLISGDIQQNPRDLFWDRFARCKFNPVHIACRAITVV